MPATSASAVTGPPINMEVINTHPEIYGAGADPEVITLGPKTSGCEGCPPYEGKNSMEFEVEHGTPVLALLDMVLIGFNNRNAEYRVRDDDEIQSPYDDLELSFISASRDCTGMIICVYHLQSARVWAWNDLFKDISILYFGGNLPWAEPGKTITCCTDGIRPVSFHLERIN